MVSYDERLIAAALTLARRHRPVWSWVRWRKVCRCGSELPCRSARRIPDNRGSWRTPTVREMPLLVRSAWCCLDHHRHDRCGKCTGTGFCPRVEAARARIRAWRRYRTVFGWR